MTKLAQAVVTKATGDSLSESSAQSDGSRLKKIREAEIRMKLDEFARELSKVRAGREKR